MRVLIACEESQRVCKEFRERGHEAYSCDIVPCTGGHPEWHICSDVLPILNGGCTVTTMDGCDHYVRGKWDLIIAHPPCTYLTNAGAVRMFRDLKKQYGEYGTFQMVNVERLMKGILARDFFMNIYHADCDMIAIENPVPMGVYMLPECQQVIQPYMFGDPYSKKTQLWLKGLPPLKGTGFCINYHPYINGGGGRINRINYKGQTFAIGSTDRSKTFSGIAKAMAEQWGSMTEPYVEEKQITMEELIKGKSADIVIVDERREP